MYGGWSARARAKFWLKVRVMKEAARQVTRLPTGILELCRHSLGWAYDAVKAVSGANLPKVIPHEFSLQMACIWQIALTLTLALMLRGHTHSSQGGIGGSRYGSSDTWLRLGLGLGLGTRYGGSDTWTEMIVICTMWRWVLLRFTTLALGTPPSLITQHAC